MNLDDLKKKGFELINGKLVSSKPKSKFGNRKVEIDGFKFDSQKEANFYCKLKILKDSGEIADFDKQVKFDIRVNNIHIANYFLDFLVKKNDGTIDYIDIKGQDRYSKKFIKTDVFQLKKKLVEAIYGIEIKIM